MLYEDGGGARDGFVWMADVVKRTAACVARRDWPVARRIWDLLAQHMRPDRIGPKERRAILQLLYADPVRRRMVELLTKRPDVYREFR